MSAERIAGLARRLLAKGGALEGGIGTAAIGEAELSAVIEKQLVAGRGAEEGPLPAEEAGVLAGGIAANAMRAMKRLEEGAAASDLSELEVSHLEAIVLLTGRPALRYPGGKLEMPTDLAENDVWRVLIAMARKPIERGSASVGLIGLDLAGGPFEPMGTGWRLGTNLIVTNRHVVEQVAGNAAAPPDTWQLRSDVPVAIDFAAVDHTPGAERFRLSQITWCADPGGPDVGILSLAPAGASPPPPLALDWDIESLGDTIEQNGEPLFQGRQVYVVGHPYWIEVSDPVSRVFGKADGKKRCSPGYVTRIREGKAIFDHDCSTLQGNSGSCVFSVDFHRVVGMHFSGVKTDALGIGKSNVAISLALLAGSKAGQILQAGTV